MIARALVTCAAALCLLVSATGCRSRGAVEVATGKDNSCLRTEEGRVYCWGDDAYTQSKNPSFAAKPGTRTTPKRVQNIDDARAISLAASHGCAALKSGGLRCFLDVDLDATSLSGSDMKIVRAYSGGVCALTQSGELKCFKGEPREIPRKAIDPPPGLSGVVDLAAGDQHVCALVNDGTVTCYGDDRVGQLGITPPAPGTPPSPGPRKVEGLSDVTALAAGLGHTCALLKNGRVSCWGLNELGQLGHGPRSPGESGDRKATVVEGVENVASIAAGYYHSCAVTRDGAAVCWGSNHNGELGRPPTKSLTFKPERVADLNGVTQIACGEWHTCAVVGGGKIRCWGRNHRGQLGDGSNTDSWKPVDVKLP